jgi:hypothetical protein
MTEQKSPLQELFDRALKEGKKEKDREYQGDRQRAGSYVNGFKDFTTVAALQIKGFTVQATQVDWQTFNPGADKDGSRYVLKILKGTKVVLEATREGASTSKNFGYEERYIDTTQTPEGEWQVVQGEFPKKLQAVPA